MPVLKSDCEFLKSCTTGLPGLSPVVAEGMASMHQWYIRGPKSYVRKQALGAIHIHVKHISFMRGF